MRPDTGVRRVIIAEVGQRGFRRRIPRVKWALAGAVGSLSTGGASSARTPRSPDGWVPPRPSHHRCRPATSRPPGSDAGGSLRVVARLTIKEDGQVPGLVEGP